MITNLDPSSVPRSKLAQVVPSFWPTRVVDATGDLKMLEHAREELKVGEDDGVDLDLVAELDLDELGVGRAWREHVAILLLDEDG